MIQAQKAASTDKVRYLVGILEKKEKKQFRLYALLCMFSPMIDMFSISMAIPILNRAIDSAASNRSFAGVALLGMLFLMKGGFEILKSRASSNFQRDAAYAWAVKVYELHCKEDLLLHNEKSEVQAIAEIQTDTEVCASIIVTFLNLTAYFLTLAGYFIIALYVAHWAGIGGYIAIVALLFLSLGISRARMTTYGEQKRNGQIKAFSLITTAYGAYKEVKIDSCVENLLGKYRKAGWEYAQAQRNYSFAIGMQAGLLQNAVQAFVFFFLAAVLAMGVDLTEFWANIIVYVMLLAQILAGTTVIVVGLNNIQYGEKSYKAFRANMERYRDMAAQEKKKKEVRKKQVTCKKGITVEGLAFRYPNGTDIFKGASIEIPAGKATAVIGVSGAGKTTFLDLALGLLQPQAGHIWYDDYDIVAQRDGEGMCEVDLGSIVSYIPQTVYLNGDTVRNNVVFMAGDKGDDDRIIACLRCAQVWEDVRQFPDGLDTLIGENGTAISGGQRQRIALARALYKDFEILIMDEATAALDMETEKAVMDSIRQVRGGKTLLMVTHHRSLAEACDHVYRIENKALTKVR